MKNIGFDWNHLQSLRSRLLICGALVCIGIDANAQITVKGEVINVDYPSKIIEDVFIDASFNDNGAEKKSYKDGQYRVETQLKRPLEVKIQGIHKDYVQLNTDQTRFRAELLPSEVRDLKMSTKERVAEIKYSDSSSIVNSVSKEVKLRGYTTNSYYDAVKALYLNDEAVKLNPNPRYVLLQADIVALLYRLSLLGDDKIDGRSIPSITRYYSANPFLNSELSGFSKEEKYNYYLRLGIALSELADEAKYPKGHDYDLILVSNIALENFNYAISLAPNDPRAYQAKYLFQKKTGFYFDSINTISSFFSANKILNEVAVKGFLSDWIDSIYTVTNYGDVQNDDLYIKTMKSSSDYMNIWTDIYDVLERNKFMYQNKSVKGNKNIQTAYEIAQKVVK